MTATQKAPLPTVTVCGVSPHPLSWVPLQVAPLMTDTVPPLPCRRRGVDGVRRRSTSRA